MHDFHEEDHVSLYLSNLSLLEEMRTSRQKLSLFKHSFLGKVLILNGEIQHIERYQPLYHEPLVHLPMCFIRKPKTALILGGGSLFAAYEILKYPSIQKVTLCDYDPVVLNIMQKYYNHARIVSDDDRFHYVCDDGISYIKKRNQKYDIIINDCFNLIKESKTFPIYEYLFDALSPQGICSDVIYRHIFDDGFTHQTIEKIKSIGKLALSLVTVPEYPGVLHMQTIFGKNKCITHRIKKTKNEFQKKHISNSNHAFDLYNPALLKYYFYMPPYIKRIIE